LAELKGDYLKDAYGIEIVKNAAHNLFDKDNDERDILMSKKRELKQTVLENFNSEENL